MMMMMMMMCMEDEVEVEVEVVSVDASRKCQIATRCCNPYTRLLYVGYVGYWRKGSSAGGVMVMVGMRSFVR